LTLRLGKDRIEIWDADDFDPWQALRRTTVSVLRYCQHKASGDDEAVRTAISFLRLSSPAALDRS